MHQYFNQRSESIDSLIFIFQINKHNVLKMGTSQSKQENYEHLNENFISMHINPGENTLLAKTWTTSPQQFSIWASNLLKINQINAPSILLPNEFKLKQQTLCGQQSIVQIQYDCFYIKFSDQVEKRQKQQRHFEEEELWYLLLSLVQTAHKCHYFKSKIGDVKCSNILLNQKGQLKLLTKFSIPTKMDSYHIQDPKSCLFSPEQLQSLKNSFKQNRSNYIRSQSFAIGMTVLSAGSLLDASTLYDYKNYQLNMVQFNRQTKHWQEFQFYSQIAKVTTKYSTDLKKIILAMLHIDHQQRLTSLQVYDLLIEYKEYIMILEKFKIDQSKFKRVVQDKLKKENYHHLNSRRKSTNKPSQSIHVENSGIFNGSFNNSLNNSFTFQVPSINSQIYGTKTKSPITNQPSTNSNRRKLSTIAYKHQKAVSQFKS